MGKETRWGEEPNISLDSPLFDLRQQYDVIFCWELEENCTVEQLLTSKKITNPY